MNGVSDSTTSGFIDNLHGFEDSAVTEPEVDDVDGYKNQYQNLLEQLYLWLGFDTDCF